MSRRGSASMENIGCPDGNSPFDGLLRDGQSWPERHNCKRCRRRRVFPRRASCLRSRWPEALCVGDVRLKPDATSYTVRMELFQIDDDGRLFISAAIHRWNAIAPHDIDVVIDLDGGLDLCIPTESNHCLYVYFPFDDDDRELPSLTKLQAIA